MHKSIFKKYSYITKICVFGVSNVFGRIDCFWRPFHTCVFGVSNVFGRFDCFWRHFDVIALSRFYLTTAQQSNSSAESNKTDLDLCLQEKLKEKNKYVWFWSDEAHRPGLGPRCKGGWCHREGWWWPAGCCHVRGWTTRNSTFPKLGQTGTQVSFCHFCPHDDTNALLFSAKETQRNWLKFRLWVRKNF